MKCFIVILFLIISNSLFGQTKTTIIVDDSNDVRNEYLLIYYGGLVNKIDQPLFGMSYLNYHNDDLAHLFELWSYQEQDPNYWVVISAAIRYHYLNVESIKFYIQGGMGMQVLMPIFYADFGINYHQLNISLRMIPPVPASSIFFTMGIEI